MGTLTALGWKPSFFDEFPLEESGENRSREIKGCLASVVPPTPVANPRLVAWSGELAEGFHLEKPRAGSRELAILAGNHLVPGMKPVATTYGGHQFGHWAGQLGDGRAILLGEAPDAHGRFHEFQLKGAGPTPYSRRADGRAVLRSSIREFICSEAMFHLGVPTTRALSVVATGEPVIRDMFYDGNSRAEPGAVVCRVAPSFLRFGHFELLAARGELDLLRDLVRESVRRYDPALSVEEEGFELRWFRAICERTALLMAHWQRVGFVHGVMNTDNMSVLGLTIDYGPYGWIDDYDPLWTPNTTDLPGRRYAFGRQPAIALWNLTRLAESLLSLNPRFETPLEECLQAYQAHFQSRYLEAHTRKLGLTSSASRENRELIQGLDRLMAGSKTDMTLFYRGLTEQFPPHAPVEGLPPFLERVCYRALSDESRSEWAKWFDAYGGAIRSDPEARSLQARRETMDLANPVYVPRNYLLQEAIEKAEGGDFAAVSTLLEVFSKPYERRAGLESFEGMRPDWATNKPGCSTLSCSS